MLLGGGDANMHDFVRFTAPISYDLTTIFGNKIISIAITTSEWTACEAHKHGRQTHFSCFAL
jgi:hypothetical protein